MIHRESLERTTYNHVLRESPPADSTDVIAGLRPDKGQQHTHVMTDSHPSEGTEKETAQSQELELEQSAINLPSSDSKKVLTLHSGRYVF